MESSITMQTPIEPTSSTSTTIATQGIENMSVRAQTEDSSTDNQQSQVAEIKPQNNNGAKTIKRDGIYDLCSSRREKILPFLGNNSQKFERLARSFAFEINTNPKLASCDQLSVIQAFYKCCEYGLDPASSLQQIWMIPYNGKIDFQKHKSINDVNELIATYGVVKLKNNEVQLRVCWRDELEKSKKSSRSNGRDDSPWNKHFEAMALIVPMRKMAKNLALALRAEDYDDEDYVSNAATSENSNHINQGLA